jgi:uncharacterized protein YndB with AHSA1/START domain
VSFELRVERLIDAPPAAVFDIFVDPDLQEEIHGSNEPDWEVSKAETDVRVGGTSTYHMGKKGSEPDEEVRVFSVVDRPHRLVFTHRMDVADWDGPPIETEMTVTFEEQDGKTLVRMVQTGFESEEIRDGFMEGWPEYLKTLERVVGEQLKARHDTDG